MAKRTTKEKGLGQRHEQALSYLKLVHKDGSPCEWCGDPMWLDATKNRDYDVTCPGKRGNGVLQADHGAMTRSEALRKGVPIPPPDRLLHAECNRMRGEGRSDDLAPMARQAVNSSKYAMPWPWAE